MTRQGHRRQALEPANDECSFGVSEPNQTKLILILHCYVLQYRMCSYVSFYCRHTHVSTPTLACCALLLLQKGKGGKLESLVAEVWTAWNCERMHTGTLVLEPDFKLSAFVAMGSIDPRVVWWLKTGHATHTLIVFGKGGLGKTEWACALMGVLVGRDGFHFVNKVDRIRDVMFMPKQGLVVDEACLKSMTVDDVKSLLDLEKTRDIGCRNRDGNIPKGTPRILSTNWSRRAFFPHEAFFEEHLDAIERRHLWVEVKKDIRKTCPPRSLASSSVVRPPPLPVQDSDQEAGAGEHEDENPFGFDNGSLE
jgi:hypothetical protein